ncbi:MAG: glycosyltransferase family 1 protein [Lachnospiraceae bacterium]|nr:glycosyltransferase family 1 protein [Lachnospiraceae bacterium]
MSKPIRVLHIVGAMYPGGMENFIMNLYQYIDRTKVQFDFVVHARKENDYAEQIETMGGRVYELPRLTRNPVRSLIGLYRLVKAQRYPIVIRHTANALVVPQLVAARLAGAKTICHSHNETDPQRTLHKIGRLFMKSAATKCLACSENAGKWMFGKQHYDVIHNAIDISKFAYQTQKAEKIIDEFDLKGKHVYGHIANFIKSKNHIYLMAIYKEILGRDPEAVCFCLGEGELRPQIEQEIKRLGIEDRVILTGIRHDVECFMSCFDVLVFPSIFEGLPLTLIEAQAAGLPCLISNTITEGVIVTDGLVEMASIEEAPSYWAERAMALVQKNQDNSRECQREKIASYGYDVKQLAKWYEEYFCKM